MEKQLLDRAAESFDGNSSKGEDAEEAVQQLHAKIGQPTMENDFLERGLERIHGPRGKAQRKEMVDRKQSITVMRQCELLNLPRATFYHSPGHVADDELQIMSLIDRCHLKYPFYGSRRIRGWLQDEGYLVNRKRLQRLMRTMGITALYPGRNLSAANKAHKIYPYLLRGLSIDRPNQVWVTDITYIPMAKGFVYLVAIMDWYSRRVLSWRASNTMDSSFCVAALEDAVEQYGAPEIFNADQGSQFTSDEFTGVLKSNDIAIRMDGKGC